MGIFLFSCAQVMPAIKIRVVGAVVLVAGICAAIFWLIEYRRLKIAQLIVENKILQIHPVVFGGNPCPAGGIFNNLTTEHAENMDIFISYFGILLGRRVIQFAFDGVRLKEVELGQDFIMLTYGNDNEAQSMHLLHAAAGQDKLEIIAEKFRRETGIIPSVISRPREK